MTDDIVKFETKATRIRTFVWERLEAQHSKRQLEVQENSFVAERFRCTFEKHFFKLPHNILLKYIVSMASSRISMILRVGTSNHKPNSVEEDEMRICILKEHGSMRGRQYDHASSSHTMRVDLPKKIPHDDNDMQKEWIELHEILTVVEPVATRKSRLSSLDRCCHQHRRSERRPKTNKDTRKRKAKESISNSEKNKTSAYESAMSSLSPSSRLERTKSLPHGNLAGSNNSLQASTENSSHKAPTSNTSMLSYHDNVSERHHLLRPKRTMNRARSVPNNAKGSLLKNHREIVDRDAGLITFGQSPFDPKKNSKPKACIGTCDNQSFLQDLLNEFTSEHAWTPTEHTTVGDEWAKHFLVVKDC